MPLLHSVLILLSASRLATPPMLAPAGGVRALFHRLTATAQQQGGTSARAKGRKKPKAKPTPPQTEASTVAPQLLTQDSTAERAMQVTHEATAHTAPNGGVVGQFAAGTVVTPLARALGWVRVRADVWVRERDLVLADSSFTASMSAADVRADPIGTRGKIVRWEVQALAVQAADVLRKDLAEGEPYFLARGPGAEDQLLYLAIPPSLQARARAVPPLTRLLVTARVRSGRSEPVGVPVLDLISFSRQ